MGIRGRVELVFTDGRRWELQGEDLFCGVDCLAGIALVETAGQVLVVENKETFMTLPMQRLGFSALIYGGGHPNRAVAAMLQLLEKSGLAFGLALRGFPLCIILCLVCTIAEIE